MAELLSGKFNLITNISCIHYAIKLSPFVVSDKVTLRMHGNLVMGLTTYSTNCTLPVMVYITDARTDDNKASGCILCEKACG